MPGPLRACVPLRSLILIWTGSPAAPSITGSSVGVSASVDSNVGVGEAGSVTVGDSVGRLVRVICVVGVKLISGGGVSVLDAVTDGTTPIVGSTATGALLTLIADRASTTSEITRPAMAMNLSSDLVRSLSLNILTTSGYVAR